MGLFKCTRKEKAQRPLSPQRVQSSIGYSNAEKRQPCFNSLIAWWRALHVGRVIICWQALNGGDSVVLSTTVRSNHSRISTQLLCTVDKVAGNQCRAVITRCCLKPDDPPGVPIYTPAKYTAYEIPPWCALQDMSTEDNPDWQQVTISILEWNMQLIRRGADCRYCPTGGLAQFCLLLYWQNVQTSSISWCSLHCNISSLTCTINHTSEFLYFQTCHWIWSLKDPSQPPYLHTVW